MTHLRQRMLDELQRRNYYIGPETTGPGPGPAVAGHSTGTGVSSALTFDPARTCFLISSTSGATSSLAAPLVDKCRAIEVDAFACENLRLPVKRLVVSELGHQDMRQ